MPKSRRFTNTIGGPGQITRIQLNLNFADERINLDIGQEAAVYCRDTGIEVRYGRSQRFSISQAMIDAVPVNPAETTLIADNGMVFLYRTPDSWFQVNVVQTTIPGRVYAVRWDSCWSPAVETFFFVP